LRGTADVRFWWKVDASGDCWLWNGGAGKRGYGTFWVAPGRTADAHRYAYETLVGPVPAGLELDHLCRVRRCCNPCHLEPVTRAVNVRRSPITPPGKTHCPKGHRYDEANTMLVRSRGYASRLCRARQRARQRKPARTQEIAS
jgi:hypothetical protein